MTKTGNSSFRKIRNAEGSDGLNVAGAKVGTLVADKLIATVIFPGMFGSNVKTITGYTATTYGGGFTSTWLNTTADRPNAGNAVTPELLILPEGSRIVAASMTTPTDTSTLSPSVSLRIGTQVVGTLPTMGSDIFNSTPYNDVILPGCDVGGGTNSGAALGERGGKVPTALDPTVGITGVTVTYMGGPVPQSGIVVTIYYV
jgi:hypothetical protein